MSSPAVEAASLSSHLDEDSCVALLKEAVAHESVTGNEAGFAASLHERMEQDNLEPVSKDALPGRPNVWGLRRGSGEGPRLLFIGHTDTVHVRGWQERWAGTEREDPFGCAEVDGEFWGRGTGDLKGGICTSLAALELLDKAGITLRGDVAYAFVVDEESGEPGSGVSAGIKEYTRLSLADEIPRPDFAVYVEPTRLDVYAAQMGFFIMDVAVTGKSAYFGVPEQGVDALQAAHRSLAAIWEHNEQLATVEPHPLVGRPFTLVTSIKGGGYIAVPGECGFSLIRKILPGEDIRQAATKLETVIKEEASREGIGVSITYPASRDHELGGSPVAVDPGLEPVSLLREAVRRARPGRCEIAGAPYWSESPFLVNGLGCPTVYCAPGDITNCHTLEERLDRQEYLAGVVAFAEFICAYCKVAHP